MKIGTIDIGTNSMRLLIAEYRDGKLVNRKKYVNTTRIGQGVDKQGYITDDAIERNIKALVEFSNICKEESCEKVYCMGTSALRDSKNKDVFVKLAKDKAGIDVDIISGEKESNLGFMGVLEGIENAEDILVIDIGGGSTEFIIGDKEGIKFSKSENVGALRMTEKFLHQDPINDNEFESMSNFIYEEVKNTLEYIKKVPPTINDPESSELAERVVIDTLGKDKLSKMRKVMPGEDFAWYLQDKPGCFAFIGIQNPDVEATYDHHNNRFNMDDTVLSAASAVYAEYAIQWLKEHK